MNTKISNKIQLYYRDKNNCTYSLHINFLEKAFYTWTENYTDSGYNDENDIRVYSKKKLLEYKKWLLKN